MRILVIDDYHLSDGLFIRHLGGRIAEAGREAGPMVILHGSGEAAERALEAEGVVLPLGRKDGLLPMETDAQRRIVVGAARASNRQLAAALTDAKVPAVALSGSDRRILYMDAAGRLVASPSPWLAQLARRGAVPVISSVADLGTGEGREVHPLDAAVALGGVAGSPFQQAAAQQAAAHQGREPSVALCLFPLPGTLEGLEDAPTLTLDTLTERLRQPLGALRRAVESLLEVQVTDAAGAVFPQNPRGPRVIA